MFIRRLIFKAATMTVFRLNISMVMAITILCSPAQAQAQKSKEGQKSQDEAIKL